MELHQLRYVVAVAQTGSFSRAAERCHVSQPSLSQQIQKLEDELGGCLFDRLKRGIKVTLAGEAFVQRAVKILEEVETARRAALEVHLLVRGTLTIGALPTIAPYLLPDVIALFAAGFPEVEVVVQEDTTAQLLRQAAACEVDLAIASLPIHDHRFEWETLFAEELLLAVPAGHRLATKRSVQASDLENERFILMKEGHCLGDQVLAFCSRRDFHPHISCRSAQVETVQALVAAGLGISLVPKMALACGPPSQPIYRSLDAPSPKRSIVAVWPRQRAPGKAARKFLACLREVVGSRPSSGTVKLKVPAPRGGVSPAAS